MSDNIFDVDIDDQVTIPEDKDYIAELVGEGKKFKTVEDLAKGKYHSDVTIDTLKSQLDELKKELNTRTSLEQFLDKMKTGQQPSGQQPSQPGTPQSVEPKDQLDDSSLEARLAALLDQRENAKKVETNVQQVDRVLKEQFGSEAAQVINHKAQELGMSRDRLKAIAAESPSAFYRLVGVTPGQSSQSAPSVPRSGVNTFAQPSDSGVKNAKYFEKLKRENPKLYNDQKTTVEMIKARTQLGAKYYD